MPDLTISLYTANLTPIHENIGWIRWTTTNHPTERDLWNVVTTDSLDDIGEQLRHQAIYAVITQGSHRHVANVAETYEALQDPQPPKGRAVEDANRTYGFTARAVTPHSYLHDLVLAVIDRDTETKPIHIRWANETPKPSAHTDLNKSLMKMP